MTAFRFTTLASSAQEAAFRRHMGARRFAYNQCLAAVKDALEKKKRAPDTGVPWSPFSLINWFNHWKRTEAAGRRFSVGCNGEAELVATGLWWRHQVCAQVFEEAAVDLGRALAAFARSKKKTGRVGFPRFKRLDHPHQSFRLRNKTSKGGIRVGGTDPRSISLPVIGTVRVREDTRRLRRLLRGDAEGHHRARICSATVSVHKGRFVITLTVAAPDIHPDRRHRPVPGAGGFVGVDRGLSTYLVAGRADGTEVGRVVPPKPLERSLPKLRRAAREASRTRPRSKNRRKANARIALIHAKIVDQRRDFLHRTSSTLVKTHDRLCLEDLAVKNLMGNSRLARPIADASWGRFHQMVAYKSTWYGTELLNAPRSFPSTKTCSGCGWRWAEMTLKDRVFVCQRCGLVLDRDLNAAVNLAAWANAEHASATRAPDPEALGRVINACGGTGAGQHLGGGETGPATVRQQRTKNQEPARSGSRSR